MNVLRELLDTARRALAEMSSTQRASMLTMMITVIALLVLVIWFGSLGEKKKYIPLNVPVPLAQAESTQDLLAKNGVTDVQYDYENGLIAVPEKDRYKALSVFAKEKLLPQSGGDGFEKALKETKFTDTQAITGHRFMEALQNEVAMMIKGIDGIEDAKVIFAETEKKSLFRVPMRQRATVTVKTAVGKTLSQDTADTIIALVAFAKSGLEPQDVNVSDQTGRNFRKDTEDNLGRAASKQIEMNRAMSNLVRKDVEELVRRTIPNCEAYVWVDTTWDLSRRKEMKHQLDAVMPRQVNKLKITERHTDEPGAVVGTQPNIRRNTNMQPEGNSRRIERTAERTESKIVNEFSYTDTETIPDPKISKQTISVVVHLPYEYRHVDGDFNKPWIMEDAVVAETSDPNANGENVRKRFPSEPLRDDALLALENAIRKAAGMLEGEENREVIIQQIPWQPALEPDRQLEPADFWREFLASNVIPLVLMSVLLIAMIFLYLQAKRSLPVEEVALPDMGSLVGSFAAAKSPAEEDRGQLEYENMRGQISEIVGNDPAKATNILRRWMSTRGGGE